MSYFDSYSIEAEFTSGVWTDITSDVITDISGTYGINGNGVGDRVASPGQMTFGLNNTATNSAGIAGYYSPLSPYCREGFSIGLKIRLSFVFDTLSTVQKFIGRIPPDGMNINTGVYARTITQVTVNDWLEEATVKQLSGLTFTEDVSMTDTVPLILDNCLTQPDGTPTYYESESLFEYVFDTTRRKTTAMEEFAKLALSELGYIYLTRKGLVVEGRFTRTVYKTENTPIPAHSDDCDFLLLENGDYLELENYTEVPLMLNDVYETLYDNSQRDMDVQYGKNIYNEVSFTAYPRKVDAAATTVLFNLESPIEMQAGETITFKGQYKDPANKASSVSGISMVTPVATTHYLFNESKNGTGTDITVELSVVATFGTGEFEYEITAAVAGWITKLTAVGKGVYIYDPFEYLVSDTTSQTNYGVYPVSVTMKYQNDPAVARGFANLTLTQYKDAAYSVESVLMIANRSNKLLSSFLYIEPGDRVTISESVSGIYGDYFVHQVSFNIRAGGLVSFSWLLKDVAGDSYSFWELEVPGKSELGLTTVLDV